MSTVSRKLDHIRICLENQVESKICPFEDIVLLHRALPEIDFNDLDITEHIFGHEIKAPLMICGMTGGHPNAKQININLGIAAEELGIPIGVGSQRAGLEDKTVIDSYLQVRDVARNVPLVGNIGAVELRRHGPEILDRVREMIDADAIAVHLNFLQESVQPEGECNGSGVLAALQGASIDSPVPLLVKETGAGISHEVAKSILNAGIKTIDVAGMGGTSWSGVEAYRAKESGDDLSMQMGHLFWSWGIPTPVCVAECASSGADVIASGGIRSGLDAAKSIGLGAHIAGMALPLLEPATKGPEHVVKVVRSYIRGLKIAMFLTGCQNLSNLRSVPVLVLGRSREILQQRGYFTNNITFSSELRQ